MIQFWNIFRLTSQYFLYIYVHFYPFLLLSQFIEFSNFLTDIKKFDINFDSFYISQN